MVWETFNHLMGYIATRICVEANGTIMSGTGFFLSTMVTPEVGSPQTALLLVSNKHVFCDGGSTHLWITLNKKTSDGSPDFGNVIRFNYENIGNRYYPHPDDNVDLACINITDISQTDAFYRHIDNQFLRPIDLEKVALGSDVLFVGYPDSRYDTINNLPLVRKGSLASLPGIDFQGRGEIVIDAQVFPGSSGSPVFVEWDSTYALLGVLSQAMVKDVSKQQTNLGLGIVLKQRHVQELVDHVSGILR